MAKHIFGPVPSRRLGLSLGVDLVPYKTCTFDCIYCECGRTTNLSLERKSWIDPDTILRELDEVVKKTDKIDYITFSGSGEPTLSSDIGYIIKTIKSKYSIPVCVLTNGSLLYLPEVRKDLLNSDIVMPSIDAITPEIYNKINRPSSGFIINKVIDGLIQFGNEYKGKLILEILFVKGINDTESEIKKIVDATNKIKPDKVQFNTCVRPGTEKDTQALSKKELEKISTYFSIKPEIISTFNSKKQIKINKDEIISMLKRRPCTVRDLSILTSLPTLQVIKTLDYLKDTGISIKERDGYYYIGGN